MKNWTVGKRVVLVGSVLTLLAVCAGVVGLSGMGQMDGVLRGITDNYGVGLIKLGRAQQLLMDLRGTIVAAALPGVSPQMVRAQISRADAIESKMLATLKDYDQAGAISAEERPLYQQVTEKTEPYLATVSRFRDALMASRMDEARDIWEHQAAKQWDALLAAYEKELDYNRNGMSTSINAATKGGEVFSSLTWALFVLTLGIAGGLVYFVVRGINASLQASAGEIRSSSHQVSSASGQVASSSEHLAQMSSQQAASLEETSASGQEISAMTQRNAENSRTAAGLMTEVDQRVTLANQKLEQMVTSMAEISSSSERIAKIIKVIDEIAFQTNILALNAAVEAARAGEAGLGFAVVADEVRNLAQRCAQAAKDTTNLIEESVSTARNGSIRLDEVTGVMLAITESAVKVKTLVDEVSLGGVEQARGIDQISKALVQMEQTTQQVASTAQQSASASQELKAQASSMETIVTSLEALISGSSSHGIPARMPAPVRAPAPARKPLPVAAPRPAKSGLLPLQKAVGVNRGPAPAKVAAPVKAAVSAQPKSSFPLDDHEFQEF